MEMMQHFPGAELIVWKKNETTTKDYNELLSSSIKLPARCIESTEVQTLDGQYDAILSQNRLPHQFQFKETKLVLVQYSLAKDLTAYNVRWSLADFGLVYGQFSKNIIEGFCQVATIGNPRFDPYFKNALDRDVMTQYSQYLDPNKKTVLYLPTWGDLSSYPRFSKTFVELRQNYNVICKTHHLSGASLEINNRPYCIDHQGKIIDETLYLLAISDVVLSDYSGSIFDALYAKKPVILLRNNEIEESEHHKISSLALEITRHHDIGPVIYDPKLLPETILNILTGKSNHTKVNEKLIQDCFSHEGNSGAMAKEIITTFLKNKNAPTWSHQYLKLTILTLLQDPEQNSKIARFGIMLKKVTKKIIQKGKQRIYWFIEKNIRLFLKVFNKLAPPRTSFIFYSKAYPILKRFNIFAIAHISMLIRTQEVDKIKVLYPGRNFRGLYPKLVLKGFMKGDCTLDLGIHVESWKTLNLEKQINTYHYFECAAAYLGHPLHLMTEVRKNLLEYALQGTIPNQDIPFLIKSGFIQEAENLLNKTEKSPPDLLTYISKLHKDLGPLMELIQLASKNSLLEVENRKTLFEEKSSGTTQRKTLELFIPTSLLFQKTGQEVDKVREKLIFFYKNLASVLKKNKIPTIPLIQFGWYAPWTNPACISLSHHTIGGHSNHYHVKYSSLAGYLGFDKNGFAGWASLANPTSDTLSKIKNLPEQEAHKNWDNLYTSFVKSNTSKYTQKDLTGSKTKLNDKYIFLPLQVVDDMVAKLAHLNCLDLITYLTKKFENSDYKIVIKRHPLCQNNRINQELKRVSRLPHVLISNESIHHLISNASAVITVNSGVGLESLIHLKKVIITGKADYAPACEVIQSIDEFDQFLSREDCFESDSLFIKKFLLYYSTEFLVKNDDFQGLERRLLEIT